MPQMIFDDKMFYIWFYLDVIPEDTTPGINYGISIRKNALSDDFDVERLLKLVPKPFKEKASSLLKIFEQQPSDVNFDTSGTIFINGESIPSSNIYKVFPALYKSHLKKQLPGFHELVKKLQEMNVDHFVTNLKAKNVTIKVQSKSVSKGGNWYFLK